AELHEMYNAVKPSEADLYDSRLQELKASAQGQGKSIVESWRDTLLDVTKSFEQSGFADPKTNEDTLLTIAQTLSQHAPT
ncbi:hypothetical protein SB761_35695, partial [Pseudomonas sp. SIMBA_064]